MVDVPRKNKNCTPIGLGHPGSTPAHVVNSSPLNAPEKQEEVPAVAPHPGTYRVLKFGGSSVGTPQKLIQVLQLIGEEHAATRGNGGKAGPTRLAVVVSAPGDTTDWLIDAAEYAQAGMLEEAKQMVARIAALATANAHSCLEGLGAGAAAQAEAVVQQLLEPLGQLLLGMSLMREKTPQGLDAVLSFGERLSATLLAHLLEARGLPAVFADARWWLMTDSTFGKARVDWPVSKQKLLRAWHHWGDRVAVVTGFIGSTPDGRTTTLGRNGSDYTATMLAAGLQADSVVVNTDVAGVMTADPAIVQEAYPVRCLTYQEALELAVYGARMFHPRTMLPLIQSGVPMLIRNTADPQGPCTSIRATHSPPPSPQRPASGTHAHADDEQGPHEQGPTEVDAHKPTCVTSLENLGLLELRSLKLEEAANLSGRVFKTLEEAQVTTYLGAQAAHGQSVAVLVPGQQIERARAAVATHFRREAADGEVEPLSVVAPVTMLSLVEEGLRDRPSMAARFFGALAASRINVLMVGAGARSLSCTVLAEETATAVTAVHGAFNLAHQKVSILLLGGAQVSRTCRGAAVELACMIEKQRASLLDGNNLDLVVAGVSSPFQHPPVLFRASGLSCQEVLDHLSTDRTAKERSGHGAQQLAGVTNELLDELARLPVPILLDCSGAAGDVGGTPSLYERALCRGIHVVPWDLKAVGGGLQALVSGRGKLRRRHGCSVVCDSAVCGGSLPVLETLRQMVRTGHSIRRIQACLSGGLGCVISRVCQEGLPMSEAVRLCAEEGLLGADWREEVTGKAMTRRVQVLLCELGYGVIPLEDMIVQPMVAEGSTDSPVSMDAAGELLLDLAREAKADHKELRFMATIVFHGRKLSQMAPLSVHIGLLAVAEDHPAFAIRHTQVLLAVSSDRYGEHPLILQGVGAGEQEAAAGLLNDVIRILQALKGL